MLDRCKGVYGDLQVIEDRPSVLTYRNVLYVPLHDVRSPAGLFDSGRKMIPAASYFRGPDLAHLTPPTTPYRYSDFWSTAGEETFLYCGHMHSHFGHFLLSTFSRFWPFVEPDFLKTIRIVVHAPIGAAEYLSQHRFATDLFASIGLQPENFVTFRDLTRIRNIVVIAPSFEETSFAHSAFAALGNFAGARLAQHEPARESRRPIWLSKERLISGVRRVVNEQEATTILASKGVEIVYPEALSLAEQAALFRDRPLVGGFAGSALHTGILAPGRGVTAISDSEVIMSSFVLQDRVNNTKAIYYGVGDADMVEVEQDESAFHSLKAISDPARLAASVLAAYEELGSKI